MVIMPKNAEKMPRTNFEENMERILDAQLFTHYLRGEDEKENLRRAFKMGFEFARMGYLSRGIK